MPYACARLGLVATASLLTAAQDACPTSLAGCGDPSALERAALRQDVVDGDSAVGLIQYSRGKVPPADPSAQKGGDGVPNAQVEGDSGDVVDDQAIEIVLTQRRELAGANKTDHVSSTVQDDAEMTGGAKGLLEEGLGDASLARKRISNPVDDFTDAFADAVGEINDTVDEAVAAINDTLHDAIDNLTADRSTNLMEYSVGQVSPTRQDDSDMSDDIIDAVKVVLDEFNKIELGKAEYEIDDSADTVQGNLASLSGNDSGSWEGNMQEGSLLQTRISDPLDDLVDGLQGIVEEVNKTVQTAISNISDAYQDALGNLSDSTTDMYYASWQPWSGWQEWYTTPSLLTTGTRTREPERTVDEVQTPSLGQAHADRPAMHELDDADGGS